MTAYTTHLDVKFDPLEVVDAARLVEACIDEWYNQTLCQVNDSIVRWQGITIPRGVEHRPRAPAKTVVLMVEQQGVIPTGN
jgi:hypothetical protein